MIPALIHPRQRPLLLMKRFRLVCVQLNSGDSFRDNLTAIENWLQKASKLKPSLVLFPENCLWRGGSERLKEIAAQSGEGLAYFRKAASRFKTAILAGSIIEKNPRGKRFANVSYLINRRGRIAARYQKIHLFDIALKGKVEVKESRHIAAGKSIETAVLDGIPLGLSICYDLRFPELYREMARRGCRVSFVPANFTYETGKAHWETLLKARAIENQMFIAAPAQTGKNPANGLRSYGNSFIIDPWGRVLARGSEKREELVWADIDIAFQDKLRSEFPVLRHSRFQIMPKPFKSKVL